MQDTTRKRRREQRPNIAASRPLDSELDICTIEAVYPATYTCDVRSRVRGFEPNVPWPSTFRSADNRSASIQVPRPGDQYVVSYANGPTPILIAAIAAEQTTPTNGEHRVDYGADPVGGADPITNIPGKKDFRGALPPDVQSGDWVHIGSRGNLLGVFQNGVTTLKASELAKVVANQVDDLLQLIGRNLNIHTDFGELKFTNNEGKVSMSLRGGSQQLSETSPLQDNFTIALDLGSTGELADFRVTDQQGRVRYQAHVSPAGDLTTTSNSKLDVVLGDAETRVTGDMTTEVDGGHLLQTTGSVTTITPSMYGVTAGRCSLASSGDSFLAAGGSMALTAIGQMYVSATGQHTSVSNGSVVVDVGVQDTGAVPSGYKLTTRGGDVEIDSGGVLKLNTLTPSPIQLGGVTYSVPLYEPLKDLLEKMATAIDSHRHPGINLPPTPDNPVLPQLALAKVLIPSKKVKIGS